MFYSLILDLGGTTDIKFPILLNWQVKKFKLRSEVVGLGPQPITDNAEKGTQVP